MLRFMSSLLNSRVCLCVVAPITKNIERLIVNDRSGNKIVNGAHLPIDVCFGTVSIGKQELRSEFVGYKNGKKVRIIKKCGGWKTY